MPGHGKIIRPLEEKLSCKLYCKKIMKSMDLVWDEISLYGNHITDSYLSALL
jgi:hypothetical protein